MSRTRRVLIATAALAATGGALGALCAGLGLAVLRMVREGIGGLLDPGAYLVTAGVGAAIGAVITPVFVWTLLRHVPLGRAIAQSLLGTLLGALLGWFVPLVGPIFGAIAGFAVAALRLRLVAGKERVALQDGE